MKKQEFEENQIVMNYFGNADYIVKKIVKKGIWFQRILDRYQVVICDAKQDDVECFFIQNSELEEFRDPTYWIAIGRIRLPYGAKFITKII